MNAAPHRTEPSQDVRLACSELRDRLRAGESVRVEDLLLGYPALANRDEAVLELIHAEITTRHDLGERPTLEEWQTRFPTLLRSEEDLDSLRNAFGSEMPTLSDSPTPGPGAATVPARGPDGALPRVGNYQLLQEIGRGGMGVVYKARQSSLSRIVALKMILAGEHAGLRERARLRNEAEAAAQLLHPNVVQIFEIGEHEGLPFLTMEYVAGGNLLRMMRGMPQAFRWSARLTETLARAIHVAHRRGIVHRDLNPSNILMTPDGTPKISDFGLAKFLLGDASVSQNGMILGTPSYMAPEQASGRPEDVGPGADVYALGALLYEMLTGTAPFRGLTPMETLCQVVEAEPVPPSRLRHGMPEDLETICLKCLEKAPERRYSDALELAEDLRRFQENQPILARRTSRLRQVFHWGRRQPLAATLLSLSLVLLVALLSLAGGYLITMRQVNSQLKHDLNQIVMLEGLRDITKRHLEYGVRNKDERLTYDSQLNRIKQCLEIGQIELAQELFESLPGEESTGFERSYLDLVVHEASRRLEGHAEPVTCLAVARQGRLIASADDSGSVVVRDGVTGPLRRCQGKHDGPVRWIAVAGDPQGRQGTVASLSKKPDGSLELKLWDAMNGNPIDSIQVEPLEISGLEFSPDVSLLSMFGRSSSNPRGLLRQWRVGSAGWQLKSPAERAGVVAEAFSWDGKQRALGGEDGSVSLEDLDGKTTRRLAGGGTARVLSLAFGPDDRRLVAGRGDGSVTVWDVGTGNLVSHQHDGPGPVNFVGFARGSAALVGCRDSRALWVERTERSGVRLVLPGVQNPVVAVCLSPDGSLVAASVRDQPVTIWEISTGRVVGSYLSSAGEPPQIGFTQDSRALLLACNSQGLRSWHFRESGDISSVLSGHRSSVLTLAFNPDGELLASGSADHTIKLWNSATGRDLLTLNGHDQPVTGVAFMADGRLASVGLDGRIILWTIDRGTEGSDTISATAEVLHEGPEPLKALTVPPIPGTDLLAVGGARGMIQIWAPNARKLKQQLQGHKGGIQALAYPCNPAVLASASLDQTICFWDGNAVTPHHEESMDRPTMTLAFSADGDTMASSGETREIILWSTTLASQQAKIAGHPLTVRSVVFCPNRRILASACDDGRIRLWDTVTGQQVFSLQGHDARINALAFSNDGSILASCDQAGRINLWRSNRPATSGEATGTTP